MPSFVHAPSVDASSPRRVEHASMALQIVRVGSGKLPHQTGICLLGQQYESGAAPDGPHRVAELPDPGTPCRTDAAVRQRRATTARAGRSQSTRN